MASLASYLLAGLAVVLVTDHFNPIVGLGTGRVDSVRAERASAMSSQIVDRTHKGDRLDRPAQAPLMARVVEPVDVHVVPVQVFHRSRPSALPVGCDALASPLTASPLSDLAGRCLTIDLRQTHTVTG